MPIRSNVNAVLAKVESVIGTDAVPTAADDAIQLISGSFQVNNPVNEVRAFSSSLDEGDPDLGVTTVTIQMTAEMKGSGTVDVPPDWAVLLRGSSISETINAATDVIWQPTSVEEALTIEWYMDGILRKAVGCVGNADFVFAANRRWVANFNYQGRLFSDGDAAVPAVTVDSTVATQWRNQLAQINGTNRPIQNFTVNMNNQVVTLEDPSTGQNGVFRALTTQRGIRSTLSLLTETRATYNFFQNIDSAVPLTLNFSVGTGTGEVLTFNCSTARVLNEPMGDNQGVRTSDLELALVGTDDNWTLTQT